MALTCGPCAGNNLELCNRRPGSNLQTTYQASYAFHKLGFSRQLHLLPCVQDFGLKYSLELFGVGQHAKTQVTKEFWS